jgi:phytoene desaturase
VTVRRAADGVLPKRVVVVGAGLGGLAAACHLAGRGHDVTVVERDAVPGGRAGRLELAGYRFDTGPTVFTMPEILDATFGAAGFETHEFVELAPVDPVYRATFADGSTVNVRRDREAMVEEIRSVCGARDAAAFDGFCDWLRELYHVEMTHFIDRNYDSVLDLARPVAPLVALMRLGGLGKLAARVARTFTDDRLRRLFSFQAMYAGLAPYQALALFGIITYMDTVRGVFFPRGGMHAIPTGLAAAAEKAGVRFRYSAPVERVLLERDTSGPVRGVRLRSGESLRADAVVCNVDLPVAYRTLLPGTGVPRRARTGRYSPSALVWHAGVRGTPPAEAAHHNIHFGRAWNESFRALIDEGRRMPDPSVLVTLPTHGDRSLAPEGRTVLYGLEPVPNLDGRVRWDAERSRARDELVARIAAHGYPTDVEVEQLVDPSDWERLGMERGTPFALAHRFRQSGPLRPGNVNRRVPGLVFVGSGTVPGVGVPMVLLSGRLAAERVDRMERAA